MLPDLQIWKNARILAKVEENELVGTLNLDGNFLTITKLLKWWDSLMGLKTLLFPFPLCIVAIKFKSQRNGIEVAEINDQDSSKRRINGRCLICI